MQELSKAFTIKPVKRKKLAGLEGFHDLIQVWACKKKRASAHINKGGEGGQEDNDASNEALCHT